jgi:hypothetical protein
MENIWPHHRAPLRCWASPIVADYGRHLSIPQRASSRVIVIQARPWLLAARAMAPRAANTFSP